MRGWVQRLKRSPCALRRFGLRSPLHYDGGLMIEGIQEEWKPVVGLEGRYEVSNHGRIRNRRSGHVLAQQINFRGYPVVTLYVGQCKSMPAFVHRLVAACFVGPRPENNTVNHKDGDKRNNLSTNLEYMTNGENQRHAYRLGLRKKPTRRNACGQFTYA